MCRLTTHFIDLEVHFYVLLSHVVRQFAEGGIYDSSNQFQRIVGRGCPDVHFAKDLRRDNIVPFLCFPAFSFLPCLSSRHQKTPCTTCRALNNVNTLTVIYAAILPLKLTRI